VIAEYSAHEEASKAVLGDVAEFVRGINFKPDDVVPLSSAGSVACMRTKNVQSELALEDVWAVPERFVRRPEQILRRGDILVSTANSWNLVGKCCWIPDLPWRASFGGFVSVLRADPVKVEPRFLFHWFSSDRIQAMLRSFGQQTTNISNLNVDRSLKLPLWLPPLAEQRLIAGILDKAETLRAKRRAALAKIDILLRAIFLELFGDPFSNPRGWPVFTLSEISEATQGVQIPRDAQLEETANGYDRYLYINDFYSDDNPKYVEDRYPTKRVTADNLVMANTGSPGRVFEGRPGILSNNLFKITFDAQKISTVFFYHFLASDFFQQHLQAQMKQGIQRHLGHKIFGAQKLPLPPIELQREFASRASAVEKLKAAQCASLARLDVLFASLQYRALRGEL
jgi:type I restriction enzyme S subunit